MPKKSSVKKCATDFRTEVDGILEFCCSAKCALSGDQVSFAYDAGIIKLYAAFERMMLGALAGTINNDSSILSTQTNRRFPKHLTAEVCEYIVTEGGYFDFKGRSGLIRKIRSFVGTNHHLDSVVKDQKYTVTLDRLCTLRNYAAHESSASKRRALCATGQTRMGSAGSWLKRQDRLETIARELCGLSEEIEDRAPY